MIRRPLVEERRREEATAYREAGTVDGLPTSAITASEVTTLDHEL